MHTTGGLVPFLHRESTDSQKQRYDMCACESCAHGYICTHLHSGLSEILHHVHVYTYANLYLTHCMYVKYVHMYIPVAVPSSVENSRLIVFLTLPCVITTAIVATPAPSKTVYDVFVNCTTRPICVVMK